MKKHIFNIIFLSVTLIISLTGCSGQEDANNKNNEVNTERMQANTNQTQKNVVEIKKNATGSDEITISEFSTKIYNKEEARQTNVGITCGKLNGTTVKKGETFSFEAVVGKATTAERLSGS